MDNKEETITAFPLVDFFIVSYESVNDSLNLEINLILDVNSKNLTNSIFEFVKINSITKTVTKIPPKYKLISKNNPPNIHRETSPTPE